VEASQRMSTRDSKSGLLYPLMVIAAIAVTVFSAVGVATMMGWMPGALSGSEPAAKPGEPRSSAPAVEPRPEAPRSPASVSRAAPGSRSAVANGRALCRDCGVIDSVRAVEVPGETSWMGTAGGAVVGGLLGNQIGSGRGRTAVTVAGAAGGAYAGNQIEKNMKKSVKYHVRVRMEDGSYRTFTQPSQPAYAVGQKVRVTDRGIVAVG
jgi:outer membrane lipoprotein SlyB